LVFISHFFHFTMSCGLKMLCAPKECFDYCLYVTDSKKVVKLFCHRAVLLSHSIRMRELITGENYFDLTLSVEPGYLGAMLELLQFMYLKNVGLLSNRDKILDLCALLQMKPEFVRAENILADEKVINLDTCQLTNDFISLISIKQVEKEVQEQIVTNVTQHNNVTIHIHAKQTKQEPNVRENLRSKSKRLRSNKNY
jgi:BTB/POZ domain